MITGRDRVALLSGSGVKLLRNRAVIRHRTFNKRAFRVYDILPVENVCGSHVNIRHVLIGIRDCVHSKLAVNLAENVQAGLQDLEDFESEAEQPEEDMLNDELNDYGI